MKGSSGVAGNASAVASLWQPRWCGPCEMRGWACSCMSFCAMQPGRWPLRLVQGRCCEE